MADEGMTITGLAELRAAVTDLPIAEQARLRAVAEATARRVQEGARAMLKAGTHGTGILAEHILVSVDEANHVFHVVSNPKPGRPANLPLWLEFGTITFTGLDYTRKAAEAENAEYLRESEAASVEVVTKALT